MIKVIEGETQMAKTEKEALVVVSKLLCQSPDIGKLNPVQLAALHVFKHEFLAAGYRLYEVIPREKANPILVKFLKRVADELMNGDG
jgi:hypothetical protein